jgi:8-oxo-dGTP pyrophosphatase MutT (NUDIX family)
MAGADGSAGDDQPRKRRRRRRRRKPGSGAGTNPQRGNGGAATPDPAASKDRSAAAGSSGAKRRSRGRRKPAATAAKSGANARKKRPAATGGTQRRPAKIPTTKEVSAGGVVYRHADDGSIEVVLASRRTRRGQLAWGLAKGGIESGESKEQAALREVREETGLTADIEADLGDTKYIYVWDDIRIRKTVHFFLMRHTGGDVDDRDDEMEEIRWFPLERAIKRAAYRGERDMLVKASELLR